MRSAAQYSGYCAGEVLFGDMTTGVTTNIDPEASRIIDGKLYLFYGEAMRRCSTSTPTSLTKADANSAKVEARLRQTRADRPDGLVP